MLSLSLVFLLIDCYPLRRAGITSNPACVLTLNVVSYCILLSTPKRAARAKSSLRSSKARSQNIFRQRAPEGFIEFCLPDCGARKSQRRVPKIFYVGLLFSLCEHNRTPNIWRPPAVFPAAHHEHDENMKGYPMQPNGGVFR